jgi:hypothetical protein
MESIGEFFDVQAARPGFGIPADSRVRSVPAGADGEDGVLGRALGLLRSLNGTVLADAALFGLVEASDFAGRVEELSRAVDYLQLVAAAAVDRTRNQAGTPAAACCTGGPGGWLTGWNVESNVPAGMPSQDPVTVQPGAAAAPGCPDDGFRNSTDFLRARLRISAAEARRRISLAAEVLPRTGMAGQPLPAAAEELAAGIASGAVSSRAASIICLSLDRVRPVCPAESAERMEHALTRTAVGNDQDFLARIAKRWTDALDQDGQEPGEQELQRRQGAFIRQVRRGLHHLEICATTEQFEHLVTVMNVATNPRAGAEPLDQRTGPQRRLDGLVGACKAALAAGSLPAAGGLRPQVMVTIDYRDLLQRLGGKSPETASTRTGTGPGTGTLMFTGPVTASTVRKVACDADIIPVLLGGKGRILDIGRASRVFPPHIRKAITARDRGCTFPQCSIPAPWCEAHHISYWSRGGSTGTGNGTLLCSHHHHLIHKERWAIQLRGGVAWFVPPPHLDPRQVPRRNNYFQLE